MVLHTGYRVRRHRGMGRLSTSNSDLSTAIEKGGEREAPRVEREGPFFSSHSYGEDFYTDRLQEVPLCLKEHPLGCPSIGQKAKHPLFTLNIPFCARVPPSANMWCPFFFFFFFFPLSPPLTSYLQKKHFFFLKVKCISV